MVDFALEVEGQSVELLLSGLNQPAHRDQLALPDLETVPQVVGLQPAPVQLLRQLLAAGHPRREVGAQQLDLLLVLYGGGGVILLPRSGRAGVGPADGAGADGLQFLQSAAQGGLALLETGHLPLVPLAVLLQLQLQVLVHREEASDLLLALQVLLQGQP